MSIFVHECGLCKCECVSTHLYACEHKCTHKLSKCECECMSRSWMCEYECVSLSCVSVSWVCI